MHTPSFLSFAAAARSLRGALRQRRDHRLLMAMSERELRDLGVGRSQVPGLVRAACQRERAGA